MSTKLQSNDRESKNTDSPNQDQISLPKIIPKSIFENSLKAKPKSKFYSRIRIFVYGFLIFIFVVIGSLIIGTSFLEFESPEIFEINSSSISSLVSELLPKLDPPDFLDTQEAIPTSQSNQNLAPNIENRILKKELRQEIRDEIKQDQIQKNLRQRLAGLSLEYIVIIIILIVMAYLIYSHTDWIGVKNKYLVIGVLVVLILVIGYGFLTIFRQNTAIPRELHNNRDIIRDRFQNRIRGR
jgi:hypothetical protein